jgi:NADH dehydrogenase
MWRRQKFDTSIVILGAGFAGIAAAKRLAKQLRGRPSTHLALVDRENYFVFQPLLPEVASANIATAHVVNPVRQLAPEVDFDCAEVERIDLEAKKIYFRSLEGIEMMPMPFTHLVLALGTAPNLGVIPGMSSHGLPMKTVGDAFHLRNHLVTRLELAANTIDADLRKELLTLVTVGGGFSGVETCAEIHDMMEEARAWYPELAQDRITSVLIASTDRILPALSPSLSEYALTKLRKRGVEVLLQERVTSVTPSSAFLKSGRMIRTRTVICTVGDGPHPIIVRLELPKERGRLVVDEFMRVKGHDNIWAIGDCALVVNAVDGQPSPPTAQFSTRHGEQLADNLMATLENRPLKPFSFKAQGYLASLGHHSAVAEVMGIRLSGFIAWWVWRTIYLFKLPGIQRKVRVAMDWTLDLLFPRDIMQLKTLGTDRLGRQHYEPGQTICTEGDLGDAFFTVISGEVEVVKRQSDGGEACIARLCAGQFFGEEALLTNMPRAATVRACSPVDVLVLGKSDFLQLSEHMPAIRQAFQRSNDPMVLTSPTPEVIPPVPGPEPSAPPAAGTG